MTGTFRTKIASCLLMAALATPWIAASDQARPHPLAPQEGAIVRYLANMNDCVPASALSKRCEPGKWQLLEYETDETSGTMIGAPSFIDAPDVTLPLDASGWHAVYVGYWNPYYAYDGGAVVKVRLSQSPCFLPFREGAGCRSETETAIHEVFVDCADLTGQDMVIGKTNGPLGAKAYVAYVKLVPLSLAQVAEVERDRADLDKRRLTATIDGLSYFHKSEYTSPQHIMELVEPYRHSDVGKVLWAVNYGDLTNYPSEVGTFVGSDANRPHLVSGSGTNSYIIGEKAMWNSLRSLAARGTLPQQIAAQHAHSMGLKFDIMFRLGISGNLPPSRYPGTKGFVEQHPQFRQILKDGTAVEKASYTFPEVREFMLSLIREATERFDVDGINLCFARGPHFVWYEQPILDEFKREHGADAREVSPTDPRLLSIRARHMTEFVRGARQVLDEVGQQKGRRLTLSIWAWPGERNVWCGKTPGVEGLDIKGWIKEGLLDSIICQEGIDEEYIALGKTHGCEFVLFTGYRGDEAMSPRSIAAAYGAGVNQFAYWDIDCAQDVPEVWEWLSRVGHQEEMETWEEQARSSRWLPLKTVEGLDVSGGLQQGAYSGG